MPTDANIKKVVLAYSEAGARISTRKPEHLQGTLEDTFPASDPPPYR